MRHFLIATLLCLAVFTCGACRHSGRGSAPGQPPGRNEPPVRHVLCLYDRNCWLNLDKAGDRDPEGFWFRAFLKTAKGDSVLRDGTLHVEMYQMSPTPEGTERKLISDWQYGTDEVGLIGKPGLLGPGYVVQLRWASKGIAGHDVEIITTFEDNYGRSARSSTRRVRVPKYTH